ncbi:MAG: SUF system NifU family Fe-S cluster assembly protein [Armatimonadota bacterium]|nr:SUF system NifU family Fe-S cluster assembly protein [Armatimonadota bacterium]
MSLDGLYQQIILDHYKNPRNFGEMAGSSSSVEHENPLCGDQIRVFVRTDGGRLAEVKFAGKGCAISQASASMMTETVKGKSVAEARALVEAFRQMMRGEREFAALDPDGELEALKGVLRFPVRIKCAVLPWDALESCLANASAEEGSPSP